MAAEKQQIKSRAFLSEGTSFPTRIEIRGTLTQRLWVLGNPSCGAALAFPGSAEYAAAALGRPEDAALLTGLAAGRRDGQPICLSAGPDLLTAGLWGERRATPEGRADLCPADLIHKDAVNTLHFALRAWAERQRRRYACLTLAPGDARRLLLAVEMHGALPGELPLEILQAECSGRAWKLLGLTPEEAAFTVCPPSGMTLPPVGLSPAGSLAACNMEDGGQAEFVRPRGEVQVRRCGELLSSSWQIADTAGQATSGGEVFARGSLSRLCASLMRSGHIRIPGMAEEFNRELSRHETAATRWRAEQEERRRGGLERVKTLAALLGQASGARALQVMPAPQETSPAARAVNGGAA